MTLIKKLKILEEKNYIVDVSFIFSYELYNKYFSLNFLTSILIVLVNKTFIKE